MASSVLQCAAIYRDITCCFSGHAFCAWFNLAARIRRKSIKFRYRADCGLYEATDCDLVRSFHARRQACTFYWQGLASRAHTLGSGYLLDRVAVREGDLVVDCGANVGDLAMYLARCGVAFRYLAIEPSPTEFRCLARNVGANNCLNAGLWSADTSLRFFVSSDGADSSFIEPLAHSHVVEVEAKRLDSIVSGPVRLLKLEAEGAEPEVIQGCERILQRVDYIAADLGPERGVSEECTVPAVTNLLLANGFEMVAFDARRVTALYRRIGCE